MANTAISKFFCCFGMLSCLSKGKGRITVAQSVEMLMAALAYLDPYISIRMRATGTVTTHQTVSLGRQCGSLSTTTELQKYEIGRHMNTALKTAQQLHTTTMAITA